MHRWDPQTYLAFADERSRPFFDLLARVGAEAPSYVVDLGCGPGNLTATLRQRWPGADVHGVDASAEMIEQAQRLADEATQRGQRRQPSGEGGLSSGEGGLSSGEGGLSSGEGRLTFEVADLREFTPTRPPDVVVSNAALQWVPDHLELLGSLVGRLAPGGWLAFQVPGNFAEPSHTLLRELAADARFAAHTRGVQLPASHEPDVYLERLLVLGCRAEVWETTYLHVLTGPDPVLRWISGTGARPVLQALPDGLRVEFEQEYAEALRQAYPPRDYGTVLPFRRIFAVARAG